MRTGRAGQACCRSDDASLCNAALHMLHSQFYREGIPRYLDTLPGATDEAIANKTGALNAVRNDVAAVSTKSGMIRHFNLHLRQQRPVLDSR